MAEEDTEVQTNIKLSDEENLIIQTLLYFDIFNYPLKPSEVHIYAPSKLSAVSVVPSLNYLVNCGLVHHFGKYNSISNDESNIQAREKGNEAAIKMMRIARRFSALISRFPFVRCVCISGSLSKGYIDKDKDGDVDYFIITKPGRLWIARTLLIAFKKVFLLNSKKYFCVNYFIDSDHLEIPDKNQFTATEVQTLIPIYNKKLFHQFEEENKWTQNRLPNFKRQLDVEVKSERKFFLKNAVELILGGVLGEKLDSWLMGLTMKRWQQKFAHFNEKDFEHALRTRKYVSKHHPQNFQKLVLNAFAEKCKSFEEKHNVKLRKVNG